jgi:anti-anti-sigma factor
MVDVREVEPGLVAIAGTVDITSASSLRTALTGAVERALADGRAVLAVDLHELEFVDAAGLGVLLGAHRRARRGGCRVRLVRVPADIARVLVVTRLYRLFDVEYAGPAGAVPGPRQQTADQQSVVTS